MNDAVAWASGLREPINRLTDPVVTTYGIAGLGGVICPADSVTGADLYRTAVNDLNNLSENAFQDAKKALPVATFSGLFKLVVNPGMKCDPRLPQPNDRARQRRDEERRQAPSYLAQALFTDDYDRAAQLAEAALEAGDPNQLDITPVTRFLIGLRVPAAELADAVFEHALAFAAEPVIPNVDALADLGNYLFYDAKFQGKAEPVYNRTSYSVQGAAFWNWSASHDNTNPDMVSAYVGAATQMLSRDGALTLDPVVAYALAYQLLPKAKELELEEADTLQKLIGQMQAQNPSVAAAVEAKLSASVGNSQSNFARLMALIRAAIAAGKFAQARELAGGLDLPLSSEVGYLIDFFEAAHAVGGKDANHAIAISSELSGGIKRSLLAAGIVATAGDRVTAISALQGGLKDAELLSSEHRIAVYAALAAGCIGVDTDQMQMVLGQLIAAKNDASVSPHKMRFDPTQAGSFDGPRVLLSSAGFAEMVAGKQGRESFSLKVPGVKALSLEGFIAQAKDVDFPRLVASVEGLSNEVQLTKAYLALAGLRLKMAKDSAPK